VIHVVLDSNIYISALLFGGNPRSVVELAQMGAFQAFSPEHIGAEVEEVLRRKFAWRETRIQAAANATWRTAIQTGPTARIADCPDPDDNRVLECAVAARAHFIVTGDRHLLDLNPYRRISIVSPRQFLDAVPWV
jgi:putative PIN family toxin of toxin-antitoxin system